MGRMIGSSSISFDKPPFIIEGASIVGQKEGDGPLGKLFDVVEQDPMLGQETWEEAESLLQKEAIQKLLFKAGMSKEEIRYIFGGDLLGQLIATTFGILEFEVPFFGLYGACSTMGEALSLGAVMVEAGMQTMLLQWHQVILPVQKDSLDFLWLTEIKDLMRQPGL